MSAPQSLMIGMGKAGKRSLKTVLLIVSRQQVPKSKGVSYFLTTKAAGAML